MHKARHRARVGRGGLSSCSNSHGMKWRINVCILAGSFLLLGSVAILQLRLAIVGQRPSRTNDGRELSSVNSTHDGRGWKEKLFQGVGGSSDQRGKRVERSWNQMGNRESGGVGDIEREVSVEKIIKHDSDLSGALETTEDDDGDGFEELENEMDMEEDVDEVEKSGGNNGEWSKNVDAGQKKSSADSDRESGLHSEEEQNHLGVKQQPNRELMVGGAESQSRADETEGLKGGRTMTLNSSEANKTMPTTSDLHKNGEALKKLDKAGLGTDLSVQERLGTRGVSLRGRSKGDSITGAFSTDDEPIDEQTRELLERMSNIEDVLMLSRASSSSKKESWGKTQDSVSLKKQKGAKILSDPLNPDNNPLLQDPDSVGQGGLTKTDRALLKALKWTVPASQSLLEDQNVHLSEKKPDAEVRDELEAETRKQHLDVVDTSVGENKELETEVRVHNSARITNNTDRQETVKREQEHSKGDSSVNSLGESQFGNSRPGINSTGVRTGKESERLKSKKKKVKRVQKSKVDMTGWGRYQSSLQSGITFSDFMMGFLFDEKCSLRVFMAWMTPPWSFTVRHQRVLESLLHFHPTACVLVFSDTLELQFFKSFVDDGYRIAIVIPTLKELLQDTPADVFATIIEGWRKVDLFYIHYTELLRLAALYKYGGIYLDFDMIILKPLTNLNNTIGVEHLQNGQLRPNGAIMVFERFSPFLNMSLVEFTATYDEKLRDWNGAALLERVMKATLHGNDKLAIGDKPHVEPSISFFPLSSESIARYFIAPADDAAVAEEVYLLNDILAQSFTVHLWNGFTSNFIPEPGSLVENLMERHCLHCTDIL